MGREWFYWGGGGGGARSSSSSAASASASKKGKRSRKQLEVDDGSAPSPGCMCAVLQLFDLPHFQVVLNHHSHRSLSPVSSFVQDLPFERPTGLEAPRNSLDMEEPRVGLNPAASKTMLLGLKQEDEEEAKNLNNISVGINQIRTSCDSRPSSCKPRSDDFSSECSSSPGGPKTPNLVARLMGLDLLPENASPTFGNSRKSNLQPRTEPRDRARYLLHKDRRSRSFNVLDNADISGGGGTVSLPETPRISLARKSDVDHHHRLSLQINKENVGEEFDHLSSGKRAARSRRREPREALRQVDENIRSPSFYARQIVKQVKESVSRKVGAAADITIKNNLKNHNNLDNNQVVLLKPSKPSIFLHDDFSPTKPHQSCSPRFRFLEPKTTTKPPPSNTTDNLKPPPPQPPQKVVSKPKCQENKNNNVVKKPAAIRSKKEEPFVRPANNTNHESKKGKRATPLSSELLNPNNVPTILPALKKDCRPSSSPPPKLPQKPQAHDDALSSKRSSSQLSSSPSQSYHNPPTTSKEKEIIIVRDTRHHRNGAAPSGHEEAESQYIQRILKRTGVEKDSSVSLAKWYSSSHPLDPSVFHYIELFHHPAIKNSKLRLRCNRKLVFQLVDELLAGILKPYLGSPVGFRRHMNGSELMETLCLKVRSFPSADCQVLEDIDALIETDMEKSRNGAFYQGEEEESIVLEIERHVVDELMHETTMVVLEGVARPYVQ
ncbi:PREDICTED: uncharacterized protein LOC109193830 [Ipomoea nil]|uniref:uncharacterized protein LOC109193830 n=1 Tax=Ipomoea nil TaxID=35883 RepID=UPI0009019B17|nr:PREDICTED: uncharacterized protein LOC109193830 [Ipomoea nil]